MAMYDVRRCPTCGEIPTIRLGERLVTDYRCKSSLRFATTFKIKCADCGNMTMPYTSPALAIKEWNSNVKRYEKTGHNNAAIRHRSVVVDVE